MSASNDHQQENEVIEETTTVDVVESQDEDETQPVTDEAADAEENPQPDNVDVSDAITGEEKPPFWKRIRWWGWCIIGVLAVVLAVVGTFGVQALMVKNHEERVIAIAKEAVASGNLDQLPQKLEEMKNETRKANEITHNGMWNAAAQIPGLGVNIQTLQGITEVVNNTMETTVPKYAEIAASVSFDDLFHDGTLNVEPIVQKLPELQQANDSLREQQEAYNAIPEPNLGPVRSVFDMGRNALNMGVTYADLAANELPQVPGWLGYETKQTYAILAMTPSEMRVSGGLVGAVGTVTLDKGKVEVGDFKSNGSFDKYGPATLTQDEQRVYVDNGPMFMYYGVRDIVNFPDTQRTADSFREIWNRTPEAEESPLDGVIIADPVFVQAMVKAFGDVTLPDGKVLTGSNTAEFLMNTVYKDYAPEDTDAYFGLVAKECVKRVMGNVNMKQIGTFAKDLRTLARNRHLSVYSFNEDLESLIMQAGFTASIPTSETNPVVGIYLAEQNPSKMGWYIKRSTTIEQTNCGEPGPQKYHVVYTITNTMTKEEVQTLPWYITGAEPMVRGTGYEKIVFFPPAGGSLSNFQVTGNSAAPIAESMNWRLMYRTLAQIQPESTVTYSFDVTTSQLATHELKIDETPTGQETPDVTYIKQCPIE